MEPFVDIHCHLIPNIDDGARSWEDSLEMARMAVSDGTNTILATPHQLGNYGHVRGDQIRQQTSELQRLLDAHGVPLRVLPGADVRVEADMLDKLHGGDVVTLGDRREFVLLELPHELYFPLESVLDELLRAGFRGILSHPERNQGLLKKPLLAESLVAAGCLMQVTAGSLNGTFGTPCQRMAEWMLTRGLVHFVASDAHGPRSRRPLLRRAYQRVAELVDPATARLVCCENPAAVTSSNRGIVTPEPKRRRTRTWFHWRRAG